MKLLAILTVSFLLVGCFGTRETSSVNYKITSSLLDAKTYQILSTGDLEEPTMYAVESSIQTRLNALGYKSAITTSDLIILYTVYNEDFSLITWNQTNMNSNRGNNLSSPRPKKKKLKAGTLYISIYDRSNQEVVWRGYTNNYRNTPLAIKAKVYRLLDEFTIIARQNQFASKAIQTNKTKI